MTEKMTLPVQDGKKYVNRCGTVVVAQEHPVSQEWARVDLIGFGCVDVLRATGRVTSGGGSRYDLVADHNPPATAIHTPTLRDAAQVLAQLRHLYANLTNGGVRDTASAKRIADGLLSPAIAALERAALAAPADALAEPAVKLHDDGYWTPQKNEAGWALNSRLMHAGTSELAYTATQLQQAVARAADVCDSRAQMHSQNNDHSAANEAKKCAAAIRAKGQQ